MDAAMRASSLFSAIMSTTDSGGSKSDQCSILNSQFSSETAPCVRAVLMDAEAMGEFLVFRDNVDD